MQEAGLKLSKGDWVLHPRMPGWGYGKVLELIGERKGRVLFLLAGEKTLSWEHAGLNLVEGDRVSQAAFNDQLAEFKLNLARDLLTSEDLRRGMTCSPCESLTSKCELCKSGPDNLRIYSLTQRGSMCLCDPCRDKIMLETRDKEGINQCNTEMEKRSKKEAVEKEKTRKKPGMVKKGKR